jgi:ABC-type transporter Mla maintaining outer membrane lipid asymmetry ATPase subunit MlaF
MPPGDVLVRLRAVTKDYRGLRPLRVADLELRAGRSVALVGFDQVMAEVLVDLITGAIVPDSGEVEAFGRATSDIEDPEAWFATLDGFGLLTDRAVLVEQFTVEQNLAMPMSLRLEDIPEGVRARVARLAEEVGLDAGRLERPAGELSPEERARVRLGRALALDPRVLLAEHPNATLSTTESERFATDVARVASARRLAIAVLTADRRFATRVASEVLALDPSTGVLRPVSGWRRFLS